MSEQENAAEVKSERQESVADGVYPVYVKDGVVYPIVLDQEQYETFTFTLQLLGKITYVQDAPLGNALGIKEVLERSKHK